MYNKEKAKLIIGLLFLTGCATDRPHNEVLIFGTTTKVALDVAAPVQNAGVPEFTLGYKRSEAVWMPLRPNGGIMLDGKPDAAIEKAKIAAKAANECMASTPSVSSTAREQFCLNLVAPTNKYLGKSVGITPTKGGALREEDTYSVFASFGGSGNLSFSGASGNLAQFFATGIAAQRLGANPSVGVALNATAPEAEAKKSEENAEKSKEVQALLDNGATLEQAAAIAGGVPVAKAVASQETNVATGCISAWISGNSLPDSLLPESKSEITRLKDDAALLKEELSFDESFRKDIISKCK